MKTLSLSTFWITLFFLSISATVFSQDGYAEWKENYNNGINALNNRDNDMAKVFLEKAYTLAKNSFDENDENLLNTTSQLGALYNNTSDFKNALKYYLQTLKILETVVGKEHADYMGLLLSISIVYKKLGDYDNALQFNKAYNNGIEKFKGNQSTEYGKGLISMSQIYWELGKYKEAIDAQENALKLYPNKKTNGYGAALYTLSLIYHKIQEYEKEIQLLEEVRKIFPKSHEGHISSNNNIGQAYQELGDYENALKYISLAVENTAKDNQNHPIRLQNLAYLFMYLGEFDKSSEIYDKALTSCKNKYGEEHLLYAKLIDCVGQLHVSKEDFKKASKLYEQSLTIFLKNFKEDHPDYEFYLSNYANALLNSHQYEEAIALMLKNINILEANSRMDTEPYYRRQLALANAYNKIGNYKEALGISTKYIDKLKDRLGEEHPDYGNMLKTVSETYLGLADVENAIPYIAASNKVLISQIEKVFKFRSEKEKQTFLKVVNLNFDEKQSIAYHLDTPNNELNKINLNNQIMLKGLLLNNSRSLLTHLSSIKNKNIDDKIITYRSLKTEYSKSLSLPFEELFIDIDSLKNTINSKEIELVKLFSSHFKDENSLSGDWKLSQLKLDKKDIAIEFSHFNLTTKTKTTDSIIYAAYLYKNKWDAPVMIPLFEEQELKNIIAGKSKNDLYNSTELYNLIWKPIEQELKSSKNVYYSPSGLLNQISIAAIKKGKNSSLSSLHHLIQLSNTGVLEKGITKPQITNPLFMGGITYDYKKPIKINKDSSFAYVNPQKLKKLRGTINRGESWDYLPGTLKEIEKLQALVKTKQIAYNVLSGEKASEAAFKKLSGNSPNILHIATHGYFYENMDIKPVSSFNLSTEDKYRLAEDPLLRSGLILAGGNYSWKHGYNPNEEEDGILTALEISNLDLSKTNMVVLSACETGLGDIDRVEGVYGLQRAFKMAGVKIIVMSLWKVPDNETAKFMNLFYENWINTENVKKSFNKAQRTMQSKYPDEPEKWAAFVLFE